MLKKTGLLLLLAIIFFLIGYSQNTNRIERKVVIEAKDEININVGKSSIQLKKDGTIIIIGKDISVNGSGDVIMKGKKILEN